MNGDALKAKIAREFGTPAVVIDLDRVERNIARVQQLCDRAGVANRPHIKTHKSPVLAKLQQQAGAKGITAQKLGGIVTVLTGGFGFLALSSVSHALSGKKLDPIVATIAFSGWLLGVIFWCLNVDPLSLMAALAA